MSENGQILGPSPLADEGFALVPQQPTAAGGQFQTIYDPLHAAFLVFTASASAWTGKTAAKAIAQQRSKFASALKTDIRSLAADQWPIAAQTAINTLIAAYRTELARVQIAPGRSVTEIEAWIRSFRHDVHSVDDAGHTLRIELSLPTAPTLSGRLRMSRRTGILGSRGLLGPGQLMTTRAQVAGWVTHRHRRP
jgi:hypothetical protein